VNHRKLLDGVFAICGVPEDKFRAICSSVDKLDKMKWEDVKKEMVEVKGLPEENANKIAKFVELAGEPFAMAQKLEEILGSGDSVAHKAVEEMKVLFNYLKCYDCLDRVEFNMSLARGLDYYTGVIYEAVITGTTHYHIKP
jgi:histidyl-tRNA synthetase